MRGSIMPEPLAMPPTRNEPTSVRTSTAYSFGNGSVVMMPRAAAAPPDSLSAAAACGMPVRSLSIFRLTPITPVDSTSTCDTSQPTAAAVNVAISWASARPCGPVHALAQPLLVMMARARPPVAARCFSQTSNGAALARFNVNTPAA